MSESLNSTGTGTGQGGEGQDKAGHGLCLPLGGYKIMLSVRLSAIRYSAVQCSTV
jgi:hypothetical protein